MKRLLLKVKLYRIMKMCYGLRWYKVKKSRRQYYFFLYMDADYENLHECLYSLSGGDVYCNRGWMWYIDWKGNAVTEGAVRERLRLKQKAKRG